MEKVIILQGITTDQLFEGLELIIENKLKEITQKIKPPTNSQFLTRKEVSNLLKVSLPTLHDWTKQGLIISYKIGNRVLYKKHEVDESLNRRKYLKLRL